MIRKTYIQAILFSLLTIGFSNAHIWVFDINDTITLRNDVDPEKTPQVVAYQLVAQNSFLKDQPNLSLEAYIKKTIASKSEQRATYGDLPVYAKKLHEQGLITDETLVKIPDLLAQYRQAYDTANSEYAGFFPSLYKCVEYILKHDHSPTLVFQSFGNEIPEALEAIKSRFAHILTVEDEIAIFDSQNLLRFKDTVYTTPAAMASLLTPFRVLGWKNNYEGWRKHPETGGKLLFFDDDGAEFKRTYFFDDNADIVACVGYNGIILSGNEGRQFAKPYIHKVDTARALTDEGYFMNLIGTQFSALSYNIQLSGLDEAGHLWEARKKPVLAILKQHSLLMLQEISHKQFMDIKESLPHYDFVSVNSVTGEPLYVLANDTIEGMAIGFDHRLFQLIEGSTAWLSDTPNIPGSKCWGRWETSFAKLLQRVVLRHLFTDQEIAVYNSHFCHEQNPDINSRMLAAQIEIPMIQKDLRHRQVISAGDRNTHLPDNQDVIDCYHQVEGLHDADEKREGLGTTFLGFEGHPRLNPIVKGEFQKHMNLDKVFYSKGLHLIQSVVRSGAYNKGGVLKDTAPQQDEAQSRQFASDHAPVVCWFRINSQ